MQTLQKVILVLFSTAALAAQDKKEKAVYAPVQLANDHSLLRLSTIMPVEEEVRFCTLESWGLAFYESEGQRNPAQPEGLTPDLLHPYRQPTQLPRTSLHFAAKGSGAEYIRAFIFTIRLPNLRRTKFK